MNWNQRIQIVLWAVASVGISVFFSFISLGLVWLPTSDLHKNSSGPGDFAQTEASIIAADILKRWIITLPFICMIVWCVRVVAPDFAKGISTPSTIRQLASVTFSVIIFNILLLGAVQLLCGISYWQERAPHFQDKGAAAAHFNLKDFLLRTPGRGAST